MGRHGHNRMVIGFTTTYSISANRIGYFGGFLSKCGCLILVLFKRLEKKNALDCYFYRRSKMFEVKYHDISLEVCLKSN